MQMETESNTSNSVEETNKEELKGEIKEENITTDGGVKKKVIKKGDGWKTPEKGSECKVHYVGKLMDNSIFDSSRERNEPFNFKIGAGNVIKGWEEGVASMKKGEISLFTISPEYAYGKSGSPPKIPPNSTLQFEIELLDWIEESDVSEKKDGSVMKKILEEGEGWQTPKDDSQVTVDIIGKLSNETVFFQKNDFQWIVGSEEVIPGLDQAIISMKKGEKCLITVEPQSAYGENGNNELKIPCNEKIKYELKLKDFTKVKEKWELNKEEKLETAMKRKEEGNNLFSKGKLERAYKKYKSAVDIFEHESNIDKTELNKIKLPCLLNIAQVRLKTGNYKEVMDNCNKVLEIDPNNVKALFRRGVAGVEILEWEQAKRDFIKALEIDPTNKEIKKELQSLKKKMIEQDKKDKTIFSKMFQSGNNKQSSSNETRGVEEEEKIKNEIKV